MYAFTFEAPSSTAAAAQLIAQGGKLLAGGQSLLPSMRLRLAIPEKIVDLNGIAELAGIRREGNALVIGAMTRHMDVAASSEVKSAIPALAGLAAHIGDRQVRARGTLGGSVANNDPAACLNFMYAARLGMGKRMAVMISHSSSAVVYMPTKKSSAWISRRLVMTVAPRPSTALG